jgi:hypothetical protein
MYGGEVEPGTIAMIVSTVLVPATVASLDACVHSEAP